MSQYPDFTNELNFPAFSGLPSEYILDRRYYSDRGSPTAHWCFIAEIKEKVPWPTPKYYNVRDKDGFECLVSFHLDDRARYPTIGEICKDGYTICIMYANQHHFMDGQIGVRVENERRVKILPCSLRELLDIRGKVMKNSGICNVCGRPATLKCSRCRLFYCNKTCQLKDWKGVHKRECKVVQQIVGWGAFDWNHFDGGKLFELEPATTARTPEHLQNYLDNSVVLRL
ncbi:hypothetical protein C8R44DRAFT_674011 [Mycena epipterygia]|nr:hypothetical protein C8R44DRAFT_674011 [Mycena epipterygia]